MDFVGNCRNLIKLQEDLREENKCMKEQMETKIVILYHEYFLIDFRIRFLHFKLNQRSRNNSCGAFKTGKRKENLPETES